MNATADIRVRVIRDWAALQPLSDAWNSLLAESTNNHVFLTFQWLSAWWKTYGRGRELLVLLAEDAHRLLGIAPLYRHAATSHLGFRVRELCLLGNEYVGSDFLNFILHRDAEPRIMAALWQRLVAEDWDRVVLDFVDSEARSVSLLRDLARSRHVAFHSSHQWACPSMELPAEWDEFMRQPDTAFKKIVKSKQKKLLRRTGVEIVAPRNVDEVARFIDRLIELHKERWELAGRRSGFFREQLCAFYHDAAAATYAKGWLRLTALSMNGSLEAMDIGFVYAGCFYSLQGACSRAGMKKKAGNALQCSLMESLVGKTGVFHFLRGAERYKYLWGCHDKHIVSVCLARGAKGRVAQAGQRINRAAIGCLRRLLSRRTREWYRSVLASRRQRG